MCYVSDFLLCKVCISMVNKIGGAVQEEVEKDADVSIEIEDELEFNVILLVHNIYIEKNIE